MLRAGWSFFEGRIKEVSPWAQTRDPIMMSFVKVLEVTRGS
jgi:hypothetical protein